MIYRSFITLLLISLGVTSFKIADTFYLYEIFIITYVALEIFKGNIIKCGKGQDQLLIVFVIYSVIVSWVSFYYSPEVSFLELTYSTARLAIYIVFSFYLLDLFARRPIFFTRCLRWAIYFHVLVLAFTWLSHSSSLFPLKGTLLIQNWKSLEATGGGILKVFETQAAVRYSGLFEEPSHFNLVVILYLVVMLKLTFVAGVSLGKIDYFLLVFVIFATQSVGGFVAIGYLLLLNRKKNKLRSFLLAISSVLVLWLIVSYLGISILEIPRLGDIIQGTDSSTKLRLFRNQLPLEEILNLELLFFGCGLGNSYLLLDFKSQILFLTIFLETGLFGLAIFLWLMIRGVSKRGRERSILFVLGFLNGFLIYPLAIVLISHLLLDKKILMERQKVS